MGFAPQLIARVESRNGVARIVLIGELDMATVPVLRDRLARSRTNGAFGIVLDLRDLTFVDCSGLRAFLAARERSNANGHRFVLVGARPVARRLFELTGTEFLLDEQEAESLLARFAGTVDPPVEATVPDRGAHV
jgi:anti-anti-sigma factor